MGEVQDISKATNMLFNERKDFIIVGLTGRTGSGCTYIANLLTKTFNQMLLTSPKEEDFNDNEERKYKVIYNYIESNWEPFILIQVRDIITSFIIEENFEQFLSYIIDKFSIFKLNFQQLKENLEKTIKTKFEKLHKDRIRIKEQISNNGDAALKSDETYHFYFEDLPLFTIELQNALTSFQTNLYTMIYQLIGNNIRNSGQAYERKFEPDNIFKLSQRINVLIKILRKRNLNKKGRVLVVIDAIRNPYEAIFFKERYSAFYLFSVNTDNITRVERLINKGFDKKQIDKLDKQEYALKLNDIGKFTSQNISKCIEISDVHLYNPKGKNNSFILKQVIKYITLIMHPGLVTPTHEERCMNIAYDAKLNSGCLSRQVGAIVTDSDYSVKAIGWNNTPEGQIACNLRDLRSLLKKNDITAFSDFEIGNEEFQFYLNESYKGKLSKKLLNGRMCPYCFKDAYNAFESKKNQVHTRALHAEENAFLQISKSGGMAIRGGFLFTTASPCELCSKKAYQLGIKKIYYVDPYPGISEMHILSNGKNRPEMVLFQGAVGKAYCQLYTPIIEFKDEVNMLLGLSFQSKK